MEKCLIEKIHRETCDEYLFKISELNGNETDEELSEIAEKCQCVQISNMLSDMIKQ